MAKAAMAVAAVFSAYWIKVSVKWSNIIDLFTDYVGDAVTLITFNRIKAEVEKEGSGEGESEAVEWEAALAESLTIAVTIEEAANIIVLGTTKYRCGVKAEEIALSMEQRNDIYYPAMLMGGAVWVAPVNISRAEALAIMRLNNSKIGVMAVSAKYAKGLCSSLGGAEGPEGDFKGGYWYHYHGSSCRKAHCWFIGY